MFNIKNKIFTFILAFIILTSCSNIEGSSNTKVAELTKDIDINKVNLVNLKSEDYNAINLRNSVVDFSLRILDFEIDKDKVLISPISIITAIGMLSSGAENETLKQVESVLNTDIENLNYFLFALNKSMSEYENSSLKLSNSIWIDDKSSKSIGKKFLVQNRKYYDSEIFRIDFSINGKSEINSWVSNKTNNLIKELVKNDLDENVVMYLVNTVLFDAKWGQVYYKHNVYEDYFINDKGKKEKAEFMFSSEYQYLEDENSTGFIKNYENDNYGFVALLPNEGINLKSFIKDLKGKELMDILENGQRISVNINLPKFKSSYRNDISKYLNSLGIKDAFNPNTANLSGIDKENKLFVSRIDHVTDLDLSENGTKAAAVTSVEVMKKYEEISKVKTVNLNRPFFYMIIDLEEKMPIFMGAINSLE